MFSGEKFTLPIDDDLEFLPGRDEKVCVVSIIGKSKYNVHTSKAALVNPLIDTEVFQSNLEDGNGIEKQCKIEGYYDASRRVVYLHLLSMYDTATMSFMCQRASDDIAQNGFGSFVQTSEHTHARALLYLFSVSHIVLLVNPGNSFDISYVRLFRVLDIVRLKLQPSMTDLLRGLSISKDWILSARPCSPRVLFVFLTSTLEGSTEPEAMTGKTRSQKTPPIKRLQHAIEDQIYRILRKARIITNVSNNSLFAIPANQEFVYIHSRQPEMSDPIGYYLGQLRANCSTARESESYRSRSYQTSRHSNYSSASSRQPASASSSLSENSTFKEFLWQHIELALTKGFNDNTGRNPVSAIFELPTAETWFDLSQKLYTFFMVEFTEGRGRSHFNTLKSLLDIDVRFSESRCAKILPLAENAYREGLPQHYTKTCHLNQLMQAKRVFLQHARGPACENYLTQLEEDCEKVWTNGRQLCEEVSLTGNHCVNQLHRLPGEPETDTMRQLPVMSHASSMKFKAGCNCGGRQGEKDDPFNVKAANHDFYVKLELTCCANYEHYEFPAFKASSEGHAAVPQGEGDKEEEDKGEGDSSPANLNQRKESATARDRGIEMSLQAMSNLSLALSLGQSGADEMFVAQATNTSQNPEEANDSVVMETDDNHTVARQHSTTEYLPGMVHSEVPAGLLPKFSSWSLLSMGKYTTYVPSQGLELPGFLHNIGYLLPWELSIPASREKWPTVGETSTKKIKPRKNQKDSVGDVMVRLYVGVEYECPRGHRFFLNSPDKIFKAPSSGQFKDTGHKVMNNDMPLYFPCQCRNQKGYLSQLTRIFVAIPDSNVEVKFNPRVQPAPPPCPLFYPHVDGPITLGEGVWVLRLPHIYVGDNGPYMIPPDPQLPACRLLKGVCLVTEASK